MPLGAFKAALMGTAGVSTGDVVLLSSQTASSSTVLDFTGLNSTYGEYIFKFYNINPETDGAELQFTMGTPTIGDGNIVMTTTAFVAYHSEDAAQAALTYTPSIDLAQSDSYQELTHNIGNGADECAAGELHIFNPASTTYVKHFYGRSSNYDEGNTTAGRAWDHFAAGYGNRAAAVTGVRFNMSTGDWDGKIKMWGVK